MYSPPAIIGENKHGDWRHRRQVGRELKEVVKSGEKFPHGLANYVHFDLDPNNGKMAVCSLCGPDGEAEARSQS